MFPNLTQDFRHTIRTLGRHGAFTASAILILAVGIAASTGLFAVVDAMVLHPLPYASPVFNCSRGRDPHAPPQ